MSCSPQGPCSGSLDPAPTSTLAARGSPLAAGAPAVPRRAHHAGGLAESLAQSHHPRLLSVSGVRPAEGEEGVQASWQGWGAVLLGACYGAEL